MCVLIAVVGGGNAGSEERPVANSLPGFLERCDADALRADRIGRHRSACLAALAAAIGLTTPIEGRDSERDDLGRTICMPEDLDWEHALERMKAWSSENSLPPDKHWYVGFLRVMAENYPCA